jgi:hypothetical protein
VSDAVSLALCWRTHGTMDAEPPAFVGRNGEMESTKGIDLGMLLRRILINESPDDPVVSGLAL